MTELSYKKFTTQPALGKRLRRARYDAGYSAEALAERVGTASSWIYAIESGLGEPTITLALRLARCLSVSIDWLATGAEYDPDAAVPLEDGIRRVRRRPSWHERRQERRA